MCVFLLLSLWTLLPDSNKWMKKMQSGEDLEDNETRDDWLIDIA